jgi:hypothetical protein
MINDSIRVISQWLYDRDVLVDNTNQTSFQTIPGQAYRDPRVAVIVGDTDEFTGIVGDTINVTIDSTAYADIDISACTDIDDVVTAINTAVGSTVASNNATSGTLQITSLTSGSSSNVTIADGTTTAQTVVGDLFSESDDRTASGITDIDDLIQISERDNDTVPRIVSYDEFVEHCPDPEGDYSESATFVSLINNRIYFGPTPSGYIRYYIDYKKQDTVVSSSDTLPFENKYDPLLIAQVRFEWLQFFDANNVQTIATAKLVRDDYKDTLIMGAHNRNKIEQSERRTDEGWIGPQSPTSGDFSAG